MADHEMVAATLAAALLRGSEFSARRTDPAGHAVLLYRQVLHALRESEPAPEPQRPHPAGQ